MLIEYLKDMNCNVAYELDNIDFIDVLARGGTPKIVEYCQEISERLVKHGHMFMDLAEGNNDVLAYQTALKVCDSVTYLELFIHMYEKSVLN